MNHRVNVSAAVIVIAAWYVAACRDTVSPSPRDALTPAPMAASFEPVPGVTNVPLPVTFPHHGSGVVAFPAFAKRTLLRVTITGTTSRGPTEYNNTGYGVPKTVGPGGATDVDGFCHLWVKAEYPSSSGGTSFVPPCGMTGTAIGYVFAPGGNVTGGAVRDGIARNCYANPPPPHGMGECWEYSSNQTVTLERVNAISSVSALPDTVQWGDTVAVTASITPGSVDGREVPWTIDSTRWVPARGPQATPCSWADFLPRNVGATRVCRKPFTRSGTLTVYMTVNGVSQHKNVRITVHRPKLNISATPKTINPGDSVLFTASVNPSKTPLSAQSWEWRPDSGALWTAISAQCQWFEKNCKRRVYRAGVMKFKATVDGLLDSAMTAVGLHRVCEHPVLDTYTSISTHFWAVDASHPEPHMGRDYPVPIGRRVYAPEAGVVTHAEAIGTLGKAVIIKGRFISRFYHLSQISVSRGATVAAGTLIGYTGNTGSSTGPHLHFQQHLDMPGTLIMVKGKAPRWTAIQPCTF